MHRWAQSGAERWSGVWQRQPQRQPCCAGCRPYSPLPITPANPCTHLLATLPPCSLAKMLFCTSLVAFVGAGEQPHLTPRRLTLYNTHSNSVIQSLAFPSSVLGLQLNRKR